MSIGPCLCGDPYCGSCGDPALAALEDWANEFVDKLIAQKITEDEARYLDMVVPVMLDAYQKGLAEAVKRERAEAQQYLDFCRDMGK